MRVNSSRIITMTHFTGSSVTEAVSNHTPMMPLCSQSSNSIGSDSWGEEEHADKERGKSRFLHVMKSTVPISHLGFCTGSRLGQNLSIPDFSLDSEFGHRR